MRHIAKPRSSPAMLLLCMLLCCAAHADSYLTILHFNDFHGYLQPVEQDGRSIGGLARIAGAAEQVRAWNHSHAVDTLFVEAGDILQGTPLSMIYRGEPDVKCLNLMDLDMMCVGNHEFDFGQDNFRDIVQMARFPSVVAFAYTKDETNHVADILLPDATDLESLQLIRIGGTKYVEQFWDQQGFALRQPVVAMSVESRACPRIATTGWRNAKPCWSQNCPTYLVPPMRIS